MLIYKILSKVHTPNPGTHLCVHVQARGCTKRRWASESVHVCLVNQADSASDCLANWLPPFEASQAQKELIQEGENKDLGLLPTFGSSGLRLEKTK